MAKEKNTGAIIGKVQAFIKRQSTARIAVVALILLVVTYVSPRFVGVLPGVIGMSTCIVLLGRVMGPKISERYPHMEKPWWTKL